MQAADCCPCGCHISPTTHVPVCPRHGTPLVAAEAGRGFCTHWQPAYRRFAAHGCQSWPPEEWAWRWRDQYHGDDLPPYNGEEPPRMSGVQWLLYGIRVCPSWGPTLPGTEGLTRCGMCGEPSWDAAQCAAVAGQVTQ